MCKRSGGVASERSAGPEKGSAGVVINPVVSVPVVGMVGLSAICMVGYQKFVWWGTLVNNLESYRYLG